MNDGISDSDGSGILASSLIDAERARSRSRIWGVKRSWMSTSPRAIAALVDCVSLTDTRVLTTNRTKDPEWYMYGTYPLFSIRTWPLYANDDVI